MFRLSKKIDYNCGRNLFFSFNGGLYAARRRIQLCLYDMPQPRHLPIIGTKLDFFKAGSGYRLHEYIDSRHKQLGAIFREKLGGNADLVFITDPALMRILFQSLEGKYPVHILPEPWVLYEKLYGSKRGLFFMNGEEWLSSRRIMNKFLLKDDSEKWLEAPIKLVINKFIAAWISKANQPTFTPDLETEFYKLSTDVIVQILLGSQSSLIESKHYAELLTTFSEHVKKIFETTTALSKYPLNMSQKLNLKVWRDFKNSVDTSIFLANKLVAEILNMNAKGDGLIAKLTEEEMSKDALSRIIADFVIAAGDTTAYTTLWILYALSTNVKYIHESRTKQDDAIKCIVKETMRLYPVAPFLTRILTKEAKLGDYMLPAGTPIIASIYTSGRNELYFSRANEFLPYRWDRNDPRKQELLNHVPSASLPFALGARSCIGKKIAMVQLVEVMSQIVNNFDLVCKNTRKVKPATSQVLVPDQKIVLEVSLRK